MLRAVDTAREVIRMATTAGLSKDVIDLMEKKIALLTFENADLKTKVSALETEVSEFRNQFANPHGGEVQSIKNLMHLSPGVKVYSYKCRLGVTLICRIPDRSTRPAMVPVALAPMLTCGHLPSPQKS